MKTIVVAIVGIFVCGCSAGSTVHKNRAALVQGDGRVAFYAGKGVGDVISKGLSIDDNNYPDSFMRLRVPADLVEQGLATYKRIKTLSFEVPAPSIEVTVHKRHRSPRGTNEPNDGTFENLYFHPGDAFVTGYVQVGVTPDNVTVGLFEIIKWNRDPSGDMPSLLAQEIHSTGLLPDDDMPALMYADPANLKTLPATWK